MYLKIFLYLILIYILAVAQISFIATLPFGMSNFNLMLVCLIFILMLSGFRLSLWWALGAGFLLDTYSFSPFGIYLISLFLMVLLANFLLANFFTDRSLYSFLALTFFSTIFYSFLFYLLAYIFSFPEIKISVLGGKDFWLALGFQLFFNLLFVSLLFYIISFVSKRLKPVFLERSSNKF
ncbi:MAG: rod shape-determining protein MreD [Patescibacteria group bacterium]|nr:rod shape-determining protein MreD [Patescibacteria group bacterium]